MDKDIKQLIEMGATRAQAKAALRDNKDVMEAAEKLFEGKYDNVTDADGDVQMPSNASKKPFRPATPDDDEMEDGSDDGDEFIDYDSDDGIGAAAPTKTDVDPYAGIFFSKDRREEVIEVEEEPEEVKLHLPDGSPVIVKLMTQGQWMKGCPEGGEQSFLFSLYTQLSDGTCPCPQDCGSSVPRTKSQFFTIYPKFSNYLDQLRRVVVQSCPRCHSKFCFACGESISSDKTRRTSGANDDPLFHCSNLQGVILGVGLSMLEQMFVDQTQEVKDSSRDSDRHAKRRKTEDSRHPNPTVDEYDSDYLYAGGIKGEKAKGGTGYAGNVKEDNSGQAEAQAAQLVRDQKIGSLLSEIRVYLPNLHREGGGQASDYLVHPTALAHLRRRFNFVSSALLRNDSLADMSERHTLYFELLEWLETISKHEALASMMAMPIMVVNSVKSVAAKTSTKGAPPIRERQIIYEGSSGPRELLEAVAIQARAALKGLEGMKPQEPVDKELTEEEKRMSVDPKGKSKEAAAVHPDEKQKLLSFCTRILSTTDAIDRSLLDNKGAAFVERLRASLPKVSTTLTAADYDVDAGHTKESAIKAYVNWATRVRFEYCDLTLPPTADQPSEEAPHYKFHFNNEARMLVNSDIPKRSLAIAKELAILTTNLPVTWDSSIFLRVDETRVDVIKALITGPEGTPYYNGCYLFDIFLGSSYNQSPPSVKYMTTNSGKYRFNPNLYADGKVCLSLLGTWSGPGWVSGKSTLLQVLISIQSMILCDEPYLNEPGWASGGGTPQSKAYSANVRRMVVNTAMLGNLKNPPEPFEDVIRTHFRLKADSITEQLDDWLGQDDGKKTANDSLGVGTPNESGSSTAFQSDVKELKKMLKELQSGHT